MQLSAAQYNFFRSMIEKEIKEIRSVWKESKDEELTQELEYKMAIASRLEDTIEQFYFNQ